MARRYTPDEFDRLAEQGGPVGVHRAPRSVWSRILPVLIAFVLAGVAAYFAATYMWNQGTPSSPGDVIVPTLEPEPEVTPSPDPEPSPSPSPEPEPVIHLDAEVRVLNASGIGGLAGRTATALGEAGFTSVSAGDLGSNRPDVNTVFHSSAEHADTAQFIAETLGIEVVVMSATPSGRPIDVVLRTDPAP